MATMAPTSAPPATSFEWPVPGTGEKKSKTPMLIAAAVIAVLALGGAGFFLIEWRLRRRSRGRGRGHSAAPAHAHPDFASAAPRHVRRGGRQRCDDEGPRPERARLGALHRRTARLERNRGHRCEPLRRSCDRRGAPEGDQEPDRPQPPARADGACAARGEQDRVHPDRQGQGLQEGHGPARRHRQHRRSERCEGAGAEGVSTSADALPDAVAEPVAEPVAESVAESVAELRRRARHRLQLRRRRTRTRLRRLRTRTRRDLRSEGLPALGRGPRPESGYELRIRPFKWLGRLLYEGGRSTANWSVTSSERDRKR